jgi:hypothetical protein
VIRAAGAPAASGHAQGWALRGAIRAELARLRRSHTPLSWLAARGRARRGPGLALARHLPQQGERVEGLAAGAEVGEAALLLAELGWRVGAVAVASAAGIHAHLDVPPSLAPLLLLRRSTPDAGGFASVELTAAPWASALGGVNACGLAALCLVEQGQLEPPLRFWVQELLYRCADLEGALEHLRRRARYAGGSGRLLVAAESGGARLALLRRGALEVEPLPEFAPPAIPAALRIDLRSRELHWCAQRAVLHEEADPRETEGSRPETGWTRRAAEGFDSRESSGG